MSSPNRRHSRIRIHRRIRKKISGTATRPRLAVHFSNKNVYAQVIDDDEGRTLAAASSLESGDAVKAGQANRQTADQIGKLIAERARAAKIENVVFDRGGHRFHGKVKALADAARDGGLQF